MDAKTQTNARRSSPADRAAHNGNEQARHDYDVGPGIDLPVVGHVEYRSVGFLAGLGVAGAVGVLDWPVAAAVGIGYALSRRQ
jgi:hypothetical protein